MKKKLCEFLRYVYLSFFFRYLSKIKTCCGFDDEFFEMFKKNMEKIPEKERNGVLLLDEFSTRKRVTVDLKTKTFKGTVDHGKGERVAESLNDVADKGLVFVYQSLQNSFDAQPIAYFATNSCKGPELTRLILKAIILLENSGAKVHGVISDAGGPNRKFWSEVGVSGKIEGTKTHFIHPLDDERKIFVFSDTPHLIKTIRNRLEKEKVLKVFIIIFCLHENFVLMHIYPTSFVFG